MDSRIVYRTVVGVGGAQFTDEVCCVILEGHYCSAKCLIFRTYSLRAYTRYRPLGRTDSNPAPLLPLLAAPGPLSV